MWLGVTAQSREKAKSATDLSQLFPPGNNNSSPSSTTSTPSHQRHPTLSPSHQPAVLRQRELVIAGRRFSRSMSNEPPLTSRVAEVNNQSLSASSSPTAKTLDEKEQKKQQEAKQESGGFRLKRGFSSNSARRRRKNDGGPVWGTGLIVPSAGTGRCGPNIFDCLQQQGSKSGQYNLLSLMKEPLRVVNSVPLNIRVTPAGPPGASSCDLISRRGVFSRRHYGSVEMLPQVEVDGGEFFSHRRFRVENGETGVEPSEMDQMFNSPSTPVIENPEYQTRWYFKFFLGKLHQNYVGLDGDKNPFFLSVVLSEDQGVPQFRAILWKKTGAHKITISHNCNKPPTVKQILSNFPNMEKIEKGPREIFSPEVQKDLLILEEQDGSVNFKFGVIYMKAGQTVDDDMYNNDEGSPAFEKFLGLLGEKIRLKGWDKYRGGLDVKGDMTGRFSYYTVYDGHEIVFHISTMLPRTKETKQQVERKRHIGNDIVNIIFLEGAPEDMNCFNPCWIKSHFTHIVALVTWQDDDSDAGGSYKLHVYSEESVPLFGPGLPCPPAFRDKNEFRDFLLVKLINGEKASFNTPTFAQKRMRTLDMLLKDMYGEHMTDLKGMLNRRAFSDVLPDPPKLSRRKEDARQVEFVRIGQALKLETIVKGDAPTSLATTSLLKRIPWEPICIYPDFAYDIICGDSWGENRVFLATEFGTFVVDDEGQHRIVFDKTVQVKQLSVVEDHGILLLRADKGRDGKIFVFRLSDFERDSLEEPLNKQDIRDHRLERTKGCHLFALSRPGGAHLRMAVAMGRRLLLLQWRHTAAWTAWCPSNDTDTVEGFQVLREFTLHDSPALLTLIDGWTSSMGILSAACGPDASDNKVCVAYRHQFDLLNERTGEITPLHTIDASRASLVAAVDVYEDEEPELLLCYNHTCHFQKLNYVRTKDNKTEFDFQWTSIPEAIVCAFPYIMSFGEDSIEIRLIVNGNLVEACTYPKLKFVSSKNDIYYATTAPEFLPPRGDHFVKEDRADPNKSSRDNSVSPPVSPGIIGSSTGGKPFRLYKIPMSHLTRGAPHHPNVDRCPSPAPPSLSSCKISLLTQLQQQCQQEKLQQQQKNGRYLAPGGSSSSSLSSATPREAFPKMGATRSCGASPIPHGKASELASSSWVTAEEVDEDAEEIREQLKASEDYFFSDSSGRTCATLREENET